MSTSTPTASRSHYGSIAIIGAGAVGVEFASIFRRFGSEVIVMEMLSRLVPVEDEEVSKELAKNFKKNGIEIMTRAEVTSVDTSGNGSRTSVGQFQGLYAGVSGSAAMFRPGRILHIGGNSNGAQVIDITGGGTPAITPTQSVSSQRQWVNATILAELGFEQALIEALGPAGPPAAG